MFSALCFYHHKPTSVLKRPCICAEVNRSHKSKKRHLNNPTLYKMLTVLSPYQYLFCEPNQLQTQTVPSCERSQPISLAQKNNSDMSQIKHDSPLRNKL